LSPKQIPYINVRLESLTYCFAETGIHHFAGKQGGSARADLPRKTGKRLQRAETSGRWVTRTGIGGFNAELWKSFTTIIAR
jgi:hypothetical protein